MNTIAVRLRLAVASTQKTVTRIAAEAGVARRTIDHALSGERLKPQTLERVATAIGVTHDWARGNRPPRTITPFEEESVVRILKALRRIFRGNLIDARTEPNGSPVSDADVPLRCAARGATAAYRARGRSLEGFGIFDRDELYVRPAHHPRHVVGAIVVCRLNDETFVKQLVIGKGGAVMLLSANDEYDRITVRKSDAFELIGSVAAHLHLRER